MNLLALDTATEACSVALQAGDAVHERWIEAPREHGERLFGMIDEVLADAGMTAADLDVLAFGRGPGAFTGVRMATGVVQGIGLGLDLPVLRLSTLAALAQGGYRRHGTTRWLAAIDARMGEVYWGAYRVDAEGVAEPVIAECVSAPEAVPVPAEDEWSATGTGWTAHEATLTRRVGERLTCNHGHALPAARDLLPLARRAWQQGEAVSAAAAVPVYLRDRVAHRRR